MPNLYYMDLETYSECPISYGSHAYAAHPSTELLLWAYAKNDEPVKLWDCTCSAMPEDLRPALEEIRSGQAQHVWHNGFNFDTVVLERLGYPLPLENCIDTMVLAYQCGMPGSLDQLCQIFKLGADKAKIRDGSRLISRFCAPRRDAKTGLKRRFTAFDRPDDWEKFKAYCVRDVDAMRTIYKKLPKFNRTDKEKALQLLDAKVNRRGMFIDTLLAEKAIALAKENKARIDSETLAATNGAVDSVTKTAVLKDYLERTFGMKPETLAKGDVEKLLEDPTVPAPMKELLTKRLSGAKTSVAKYQRALNAQVNGRLKGCLQFRGASRTGRYSGRIFQPQNLPRPSMSNEEIEAGIEAIKVGSVGLFYDDYSALLSDAMRGLIIAPEGKKLCVADYSNVEGRVLAWLAGEQWKLQAFNAFDEGHGHDLYKVTYGKTFGVKPDDVTKKQRQIGKVEELALGYGGGAGAFAQFARLYGIDLDVMSKEVKEASDPVVWSKSEDMYDWAKEQKLTAGLSRSQWIASNTVKQSWRDANPSIVKFWALCERAVRSAINNPGTKYYIRPDLYALKQARYLVLRLPSGRFLSYPLASAPDDGNITYYGVNQYSRKFEKIRTYGPKICENVTQSVACDLLLEAGLRLEAAGYEIVLSVHDEYICEICDDKTRNHHHMEKIMSELPVWAEGLPLAAAGFESYRYRK